jgi:hypothetical protein
MDIKKLIAFHGPKELAVDACVPTSNAIHVDNSGWRIWKRAKSERVNSARQPITRPIDCLRQGRDTAFQPDKHVIEFIKQMKPVFDLGYIGHPNLVDPTRANLAPVFPMFDSIDVRNIPKEIEDGYE